jgi:uncharacterized protein (DUF488 family)
LDEYKKNKGDWEVYEKKYMELITTRKVESFPPENFDDACLLCSEDKPEFCHRRLAAEYLLSKWGSMKIKHLI